MFDAHRFEPGVFAVPALGPDPAMQPTRALTRPARPPSFVPLAARLAPAPVAVYDAEPAPPAAEAIIDGTAREAQARADGVEEGYAIALMELAEERQSLARLVAGLDALQPEPPRALALLLAESVGRLVRQVVGEVAIDPVLLAGRAGAVAAMVTEEVAPRRLKLHPDDVAHLEGLELAVEIAADPHLARGTVQLDCGDGWIEDGPDAALDRLHAALDRMGVAP